MVLFNRMDELEEAPLLEEPEYPAIEGIIGTARLLPLEPVLLPGLDGRVAQEAVDRLIRVVEAPTGGVRGLVELDVPIVLLLAPVPEILVTEAV
jgi:hypothetical protein